MEGEKNKEQPKKFTYEELLGIAGGLKEQNDQLKRELDAMRQYISEQQTQSIFAYLGVANNIMEHTELFDTEFVGIILDDVKKVMLALREIIVPSNESKEKEDGDGASSD